MNRIPVSLFVWLIVVTGLFAVMIQAGHVPLSTQVVTIILVCFFCELVDSSIGMGFGTILTPVLLLAGFSPHQLVPAILISEFLSGFAGFFFHAEAGNVRVTHGSRHAHTAVLLSLFSLIGIIAGVRVAFEVSRVMLTRIIGVIILVSGLVLIFLARRTISYHPWKVAVLSVVASFNKALSGGGYGPLVTSGQLLSGIEARAAVGITSLAEGFTCLGGAILFLLFGEGLDLALLIPVATGALLSVPFPAQIVRRAREDVMKLVVAVLTVLLGALTLVRSFL